VLNLYLGPGTEVSEDLHSSETRTKVQDVHAGISLRWSGKLYARSGLIYAVSDGVGRNLLGVLEEKTRQVREQVRAWVSCPRRP